MEYQHAQYRLCAGVIASGSLSGSEYEPTVCNVQFVLEVLGLFSLNCETMYIVMLALQGKVEGDCNMKFAWHERLYRPKHWMVTWRLEFLAGSAIQSSARVIVSTTGAFTLAIDCSAR